MPSKYSIKDLELMSGIKAHTLRIWELRYKILKPERTATNIRYYNNADLKRILNISLLNKNGFKISNIARLNDERLVEEVEKFLGDYLKENNKVESLYLCLLDMDEDRFETILNSSFNSFGFENTMEKIVFPFLKHVGNMWQVGMVSPAQEHYISNLIRQKLIVGLDKLAPEPNSNFKTYLFFLPNNELHEMGLLYCYYLAKSKGHKCVYLGQSVPTDDLFQIAKTVGPDYLVTILTASVSETEMNLFFKRCDEEADLPTVFISGRLLLDPDEKVSVFGRKFRVFKDFQDFKNLI
jgi:DNA-binding transcriptional MerR regulator